MGCRAPEDCTLKPQTQLLLASATKRYSGVEGGSCCTSAHSAFWTACVFRTGYFVGVTARPTRFGMVTGPVRSGGTVKGEPATSVSVPPDPMENTEMDPGTAFPLESDVCVSATKRYLPAESIVMAAGSRLPAAGLKPGAEGARAGQLT